MAQDLQFVSSGLAKPPFNKKVTIFELDGLEGAGAVQFLSDVFSVLDHGQGQHVEEQEDPQETAIRFFTFLRLIRYPSPEAADEKSIWRQDIIEGKRRAILQILLWIVRNVEMVQQRVYLAKFITKVEVPAELRSDPEINAMCEEQDRAIAGFAPVHRQFVQLKSNADEVDRLRADIKELRAQKEQAEKRVEELNKRIRGLAGKNEEKEARMASTRTLREEREKSAQLTDKRVELTHLAPAQNEQISRLQEYTAKITDDWLDMSPEKLLRRMEDRLNVQRRAVEKVLPKALEEEKAVVAELRTLVNQSDFTERNLNELRIKAQMLQTEIFNMSDKLRNVIQGPAQAQLNFYRSQSEAADTKKRDVSSRNDALYKEVRDLERRIKQKRAQEGQSLDEDIDVASISATIQKNNEEYEKKLLTLKSMEAEKGHLTRTNAILANENDRIEKVLNEWEKRTGTSPLKLLTQNVPTAPTATRQDSATLAHTVRDLEKSIASKRVEISALLNELQPIRQKHKSQQDTVQAERQRMQSEMKQFSGTLDATEKDVVRLRQEVGDLEEKLYANGYQSQYVDILANRAETATSDNQFMKSLQSAVQKESARLPQLQSQHEELKNSYNEKAHQASAWRDLNRLFDLKLEHVKQELQNVQNPSGNRGGNSISRDRIVMS